MRNPAGNGGPILWSEAIPVNVIDNINKDADVLSAIRSGAITATTPSTGASRWRPCRHAKANRSAQSSHRKDRRINPAAWCSTSHVADHNLGGGPGSDRSQGIRAAEQQSQTLLAVSIYGDEIQPMRGQYAALFKDLRTRENRS